MMQTERCTLTGPSTYFFTVRLREAGTNLLTRQINQLRLSVRLCQFRHPFIIDDAVILPDRLHTIWTLPAGDDDYAVRWQTIKSTFARQISTTHDLHPSNGIWQRRFWEHQVLSLADLAECQALIRQAPVQAGLVTDAADWPFSYCSRTTRTMRGEKTPHLRIVHSAV